MARHRCLSARAWLPGGEKNDREFGVLAFLLGGTRFALLRLFMALTISGSAGCLLPPPIEESALFKNQPPRIEPDSLTPAPTDGPKVMTTQCTSYGFFATLEDPDAGDTIYWRVFLDYNHQQVPNLLATSTAEAAPGQQITFNINPSDRRFFTSGKFTELHVVELFISDRPFILDERRPYARAVPADGLTDSFVWPIALNDQDACISAGVP